MDLLHPLIEGDKWLFELINGRFGNPIFDLLLPLFREKWFWAPLYLFIAAYTLLNFGKKGWFIIIGLVVAVGLADFTSSSLIKKTVQRIRPCNDVEMLGHVTPRVSCGGGYSFTSSHAANHFAAAVFLIGVFGLRGRWPKSALLAWAGLIAFSQVYVGVHYPLDVLAGSVLGAMIGWVIYKALLRLSSNITEEYHT